MVPLPARRQSAIRHFLDVHVEQVSQEHHVAARQRLDQLEPAFEQAGHHVGLVAIDGLEDHRHTVLGRMFAQGVEGIGEVAEGGRSC